MCLVCGIALLSGQTQTVSYTTFAKPVARVLADLSQQLNRPFQVDEMIGRQPIIISVNDVPAQELLDRIAKVSFGHWTKNGGTDLLTLDQGAIRAAEQAQERRWAAPVANEIADMMSRIDQVGPLTEEKAEALIRKQRAFRERELAQPFGTFGLSKEQIAMYTEEDSYDPERRAMYRILSEIGADAIARLEHRVVYSSSPTQTQVSLGDAGQTIFEEYVNDKLVWDEAETKVGLPDRDSGLQADPGAPPIATQAAKFDFVVAQDKPGRAEANLEILSPSGAIVDHDDMLVLKLEPDNELETTDNRATPSKADLLHLSKESDWILEDFAPGANPKPPPEGLIAKLIRPDLYEPLAWSASEILIQYAKHMGEQLVAMLPDTQILFTGEASPTARIVADELAKSNDVTAFEVFGKTDWLEVLAKNPPDIFDGRMDRVAMAKLISAGAGLDAIPFENICDYCSAGQTLNPYLEWLLKLGNLSFNSFPNDRVYAFAGELDPAATAQIKDGIPIRIKHLGPAATQTLNELVFDFYPAPLKTPESANKALTPMGFPVDNFPLIAPNPEPTEILPKGLPPDGTVSFVDKETPTIFGRSKPRFQHGQDVPSRFEPMGLNYIAALRRDEEKNPGAGRGLDLNDLRLGTMTRRKYHIAFTPTISYDFSLLVSEAHGDEKFTFDTLPEDMKKTILSAEEVQRKRDEAGPSTTPGSP